MSRILLTGGDYRSKSVIANAQTSVNLYAEKNTADSPTPFTYYPTPGLQFVITAPTSPGRGIFTDTGSHTYCVFGNTVYRLDSGPTLTSLGTIGSSTGPVRFEQFGPSGAKIMLVDGTTTGYVIDIASQVLSTFVDATGTFAGGWYLGQLDGFLLSMINGTNQFVSSLDFSTTYDPTYVASKAGYPDPLQGLIVTHREIWLIGTRTTEVWFDAGNSGFPFAILPGAFIQYGCAAEQSIAKGDVSVFFLSRNDEGALIVLQGQGYSVKRISNHGVEAVFATYTNPGDAIGYCYQLEGHIFYVLTFQYDNATWVYDISTDSWHQWAWTNPADGSLNRHRVYARTYNPIFASSTNSAYGVDWQNGNLYLIGDGVYLYNGNPITRIRTFPHLPAIVEWVGGQPKFASLTGKRLVYNQVMVDMDPTTTLNSGVPYNVTLSWSDDRGHTFPYSVSLPLTDAQGDYLTSIQARQLGLARDRVFRVTWTAPVATALNGLWVDVDMLET